MKGFNIAPQPSGTSQLPPVAEFIAALQHEHGNHHELFGSTLSGIFGSGHAIVPKKPIHQHSTVSSSQGSICEGQNCHHRGFGR